VKLLIAVDSFGQFANADEIAKRVAAAVRAAGHEAVEHPMTDGGEGMLSALAVHRDLRQQRVHVNGPFGEDTEALVGWYGEMAIVESDQACGWPAIGDAALDPSAATSAGVGQLLKKVAARSDGPIVLGLGGSVSVDGGLGALQSLGLLPLNAKGRRLEDASGLDGLAQVRRLVGQPTWDNRLLEVLTDVRTPLLEAPAAFGPQKGLATDKVNEATEVFQRWGEVLQRWRHEHNYAPLELALPGGAAAGGLGYALAAVLNTGLYAGAPRIARMTGLHRAVANADRVITGEGKLDATSYTGKVADAVIQIARQKDREVWAIVGQVADSRPPPQGPDRIFTSTAAGSPDHGFSEALNALSHALNCE